MKQDQSFEVEQSELPYREKIAWLSLIAMAATYGPYFLIVVANSLRGEPLPNFRQLGLFAVVSVVQMLILGAGHLWLRRRFPVEARTPPDERDRAIKQRSISLAYHLLIGGMVVVGCVMPFRSGGWEIINAALFTIILAEVVHYGAVVVGYRSQS